MTTVLRKSLVGSALALLLWASGCSATRYMLYLLAPAGGGAKVPAEFEGLTGKSVAIVIYVDQQVQYEYPYAALGVSSVLASELQAPGHVKDLNVIDPRRVVKYQQENIYWDRLNKTELGKTFGADYVLYVVIDEYTMREPGSINLYRGSIAAQASVYQTDRPEREARVWQCADLRVAHPANALTGEPGQDDTKIRYDTEKKFADLLAKKFYRHEVRDTE